MANFQVGDNAPDFTLYDTEKNKVSVTGLKGKNALLLFFPLAFSRVCTAELCSVRDSLSIYNDANAEVIGISVDSVYVLNKFKEDQGFKFTLLSDFNKEASAAYNVLYEIFPAFEMKGVSKRAAFVLDKEGAIRYAEVCASPGDQPDFNAIRSVLTTLN
jgi:peroxiredoxin